MIGIIIIILILLHIIYLNTKHIEKFGGMDDCNALDNININSEIGDIINKLNDCIKGIKGEIKSAASDCNTISNTIPGYIEDKLYDILPIKKINNLIDFLANSKKNIFEPVNTYVKHEFGVDIRSDAEELLKEE